MPLSFGNEFGRKRLRVNAAYIYITGVRGAVPVGSRGIPVCVLNQNGHQSYPSYAYFDGEPLRSQIVPAKVRLP